MQQWWFILLEILIGAMLAIGIVHFINRKKLRQKKELEDKIREHTAKLRQEIIHREQAERALRESEEKYRNLFEKLNDAAVLADTETGIVLEVNRQAEILWGCSRDELIGFHHTQLHNPEEKDIWRQKFQESVSYHDAKDVDAEILRKDGKIVPVIIRSTVFKLQGRECILGLFLDITKHKHTEKALSASLKEKEVLLREIHHRVKNNMQIVISLLNLQSRQLKEEQILEVFQESQNRIKAMALIHETLFQSSDLSHVDAGIYINKLANALFQVFGTRRQQIRLNVSAKDIFLVIDDAVPIGLVINELITNALKYAFPDGRHGKIEIIMRAVENNMFELLVSDDGVGFSLETDFENTGTLGLMLIKGLVEDQLEGKLEMIRNHGTSFIIRFSPKKL